jgi:tetratricopeptide (TPR) repeat protein
MQRNSVEEVVNNAQAETAAEAAADAPAMDVDVPAMDAPDARADVQLADTQAADANAAPENGAAWGWLRRWFLPTASEQAARYHQRLAELDQAIALHPEAVSNYVLRGELHLWAGYHDLAVADFQQALALGTQQLEAERWGVITQAMRDRAFEGLNRALRLRAK